MTIYSLLGLLFGLGFDPTWIHDELIFHDYCHIPNPKFGFVWLDESKFDFVVFLQQLLMLSFSFQLFAFLFGQVHWQYYPRFVLCSPYLLQIAVSRDLTEINQIFPFGCCNCLQLLFKINFFAYA